MSLFLNDPSAHDLIQLGQVARGDFIVFFNDIFDALCKLSADSDPNVQSAAHLLDRLVKVATLHISDLKLCHLSLYL